MSNRLINETSPYLLQHANNPVDWFAWRPDAFEKAKAEDKPILVSIGYSTCHWCHVMEHESFEDEEIAGIMNELFVCIKVDREERPDIDMIYMEAVQMISGSGGWPLNCFLLPDGSPIYGGTYFPPEERYGKPSWRQVLLNIAKSYQTQKNVVVEQAKRLKEAIQNNEKRFINQDIVPVEEKPQLDFARLFNSVQQDFDTINGGMGGAPKFPQTATIDLLNALYYYYGIEDALQQATLSLGKMISGGIYDQLRGGFSRYATDRAWLIPHFEKMLYDNALILRSLADTYRLNKSKKYERAILETLAFLDAEMTHSEGGFYSALDADSEGVEGKFYVWSKEEIDRILGEDSTLFCQIYNVTEHGNWEEVNILNLPVEIETYCKENSYDPDTIYQKLETSKQKLLVQRNKRIHPGLDDKILMGWNALMITSLSELGQALNNTEIIGKAVIQFEKVRSYFKANDHWYHSYKNAQRSYMAMLDDYAYWIEACLSLHQVTQDSSYIIEAEEIFIYVISNFYDKNDGLFYYTSAEQNDIIIRKKELFDNATPSGNAVMCRMLFFIGILKDNREYITMAERMIRNLEKSILLYPTSFAYWVKNLIIMNKSLEEIVITGPQKKDLYKEILKQYSPARLVMIADSKVKDWPMLYGKDETDETLIYFCKEYNCQEPVHNLNELIELMRVKLNDV